MITSVVGLAWHHIVAVRSRTMLDILGLGVSVSLAGLITLLVIPPQVVAGFVQQSTIPSLVFRFLGTFIIGVLLDHQQRRRDLAMSNIIYRAMVRELPDFLNVKDADGRFGALFPDGRQGWLYTVKTPFRDEAGKIVGSLHTIATSPSRSGTPNPRTAFRRASPARPKRCMRPSTPAGWTSESRVRSSWRVGRPHAMYSRLHRTPQTCKSEMGSDVGRVEGALWLQGSRYRSCGKDDCHDRERGDVRVPLSGDHRHRRIEWQIAVFVMGRAVIERHCR